MSPDAAVSDDLREVGKEDELRHWRTFVTTDRFFHNWLTAVPNPEMDFEIELFVKGVVSAINRTYRKADILDIGSGPVSILSKSLVDFYANLVAADPLADDYDRLWNDPRKKDVTVPVACPGEELSRMFGHNAFDISHVRNAIDHSVNPKIVIEEMIKITRPGGYIIIHGFENEADAENWQGYHQWNLHYENSDLIVRGRDSRFSVREAFAGSLKIYRAYSKLLVTGKTWCALIAEIV